MDKLLKHARGTVWYINDFIKDNIESAGVQRGTRPCVIVSNNQGNATGSHLTVAMVTTRTKPNSLNVPFLNMKDEQCYVLCNQLHTVNKTWLSNNSMGTLPEEVMKKVDECIMKALNLHHEQEVTIKKFNELGVVVNSNVVENAKEVNQKAQEISVKHESTKVEPVVKKEEAEVKVDNEPEVSDEIIQKRMNWTDDKKKEYIQDYKKLSLRVLMQKYNIKSEGTAVSYNSKFRKQLGKE